MKDKRLLCLAAVVILLTTGCQKTQTAPDGSEEHKNASQMPKIQIGMTLDSKVLERWVRDVDVFTERARRQGAEVDVQSANGDVRTQIAQIDAFIKSRKDVIVIIAADCNKLSEVVERAHEAGIKVVSYDRLIQNAPSDLYISFDNEKIGRLMAETMKKALPDGGKIVMVCGPKSDSNAVAIEAAFKQEIKETRLEIVQVGYAKGWTAEYAFQAVADAFSKVDEVDGVMCENDALAVQAIHALSERQMAGKVCVVGQDADVEACQKVVEGIQRMTVYKDIDKLARKAADYSVMLAQNIKIDNLHKQIKTGTYSVKELLLEPIAVTKENMQKVVIDSGFHKKEDVYLNVNPSP